MNELIQYLKDHFIPFLHISDRVVEIGVETYELSFPNESNSFFDRDFHWDTAYTECDNYIYFFGGVWYWLKKGDENDVKLNKVLYLSEPGIEEDFRESAFLGVHGNMQLLDGMHSYDEWCNKAKWLGITILGICEKGHLSGAFKFQEACQKYEIKPVFGMEVPVLDEERDIRFTIKVYARDEDGWRILLELNRLCNVVHKEYCTLNEFVLLAKSESYKEHTFTVADPKTVECQYLLDYVLGKDEMYVQFDTVEYEQDDRDKWYLENLKMFYSRKCRFIAICDAYYLEPEYAYIREKINSILKITNYKSSNQYFKNFQEYFFEMQALFGNDNPMFDLWDDAIENLHYVSENCNFAIDSKSRHLPWYIMTEEEKKRWRTNDEMFVDLIYEGLENHPELIEEYGEEAVFARIDEEIDVIRFGGVVDYFLILRDIVNWARSQNILVGPGRGSAAGSLVVYLLGLTKVNPLKYGLFFSRFLNKGRIQKSLPDIDTDFPTNRRQEVKRYMEERFGTKQVCAVGTYTTLQLKAAINDMGDKYGVAIPERKRISKMLGEEKEKTVEDLFRTALKKAEFRAFMRKNTEMFNDLFVILGAPKARSIHACAEMIFPQDRTMFEWSPLRLESDTNQMVCEWEGGELDHAGFLKEDILGLNQLDKIHDILELIKQNTGITIDPYKDIPLNEPEVMKYFGNGWNGDVFQFTAKGMNGYAQIMKPNSVEELSACTALYRPGPLENGFHFSYVKRKSGDEEVEYYTGTESFLKDTQGLLLYQENCMSAFIELAGFTSVEADSARRAIGKKIISELESLRSKFVDGYVNKWGVTPQYADLFFDMILKFAGYGFNKCISGREEFYRFSLTKGQFRPTIGEMYRIANDSEFARNSGHLSLHRKYCNPRFGFGSSWTLCDDGKIRKSKIKNISYAGNRQTYKITLSNGKTVSATANHKFPTQRGLVELGNLIENEDCLYYNKGYKQSSWDFVYTDKVDLSNRKVQGSRYKYEHNSEKGKMGFQEKDTSYTRFQKYVKETRPKITECQICGKPHKRLEVHHLDGDHGNSEMYNLAFVCPSCHKKAHYQEYNRVKVGEKGLESELVKIVSIKPDRIEPVYDVEIDHPEHNYVTGNGIVTSNSHAVSYSIISYICQWLKVHYPMEFWSVTFTWAKMDEYPLYINEIEKTGNIGIKTVNINHSRSHIVSDKETNSMYWSLNSVKQIGEQALNQLNEERDKNGEYFSLEEFLDRHNFKNSKVTKSAIENLIYCGAFDELEHVEHPSERYFLLDIYRTKCKVKVDKSKDKLSLGYDKGKHEEDWWWMLMQRNLCGFGEFDHETLSLHLDKCTPYFSPSKLQEYNGYGYSDVKVGGYVMEVEEKKTKNGFMGFIKLDCNYNFVHVVVGCELYEEMSEYFKNSKDCLLYLTGYPTYSKFDDCNIIQTTRRSQFVRLKLD